MERTTTLKEAQSILGKNFLGPGELVSIAKEMGISVVGEIPSINIAPQYLFERKDNYLLILGVNRHDNGATITLKSLCEKFGYNPDESEPCFYNQDWYINELFYLRPLEAKWFFIRKDIIDISRGINPDNFCGKYSLPTAVECAYVFFCNYFHSKEILWKNDFVWCSDVDSNDDRIYVGRYFDPIGKAKNGFSIHRHLSIRNNYGVSEIII